METNILIVIGIIVLIAIVIKLNKTTYKDIDLAIPSSRRTDLLYGYYSSLDRSYEQTKDHINLFWYSHFFGFDKFVEILKDTSCKVVLDLAPILLSRDKATDKDLVKETAEEDLRNYFNKLKDQGVLGKISYLYPVDEPQLKVKDEAEHLKAIQVVKKVKAEYPELTFSRIAVIYLKGKPFWNLEEHDVVGIDDYDQKSEILTKGEHARLVKAKKPEQRTMLVPGAGFGQNPDPFVAYALLNQDEVEIVVPFIWFDDPNHKDVPYIGLENAQQDFKQKWLDAADICLNRK